MSFLIRTKQLKTIAGIGLVLYGALGDHGLVLIGGVALIAWSLLRGAGLWRHGGPIDPEPPTTSVSGEGLRPPFSGPNR